MAAELGSDMPFCVAGGSQFCFGRGERLEPLPPCLEPLTVLLVKDPRVSVSTPWAYKRCRERNNDRYLEGEQAFEERRKALRQADWTRPLRAEAPPPLRNDLQSVVEPETDAVQIALRLLRTLEKPLAVAMSGSGPSCFALFRTPEQCQEAQAVLSDRFREVGLLSWCCPLRSDGVRIEA